MDQRDTKVLRIILIEGSANIIVFTIKLAVGLSTNSLAVLSDAIHSLTDIFNNIIALFVTRHSTKPADTKHPYGHRKFETVAVFALAALLVILAFELAVHAFTREAVNITTSNLELALMLGVLITNLFVSIWQRHWARRLKSDILTADANHTFSDALVTTSVIIGWQLSAKGWLWVDQICTLVVAGLIFYLAFSLFKRTIPVLLDERAIDSEKLKAAMLEIEGICSISRIRSRWIGSTRAVDLVIEVDSKMPTAAAHEITERVESLLENQFDVKDISIHVEPHYK